MFKQLFTFSFLSLIAFTGCRKEMIVQEAPFSDAASDKTTQGEPALNSVVSSAHWYGSYAGLVSIDGDPDEPDIIVYDANFIHNGVAKLPGPGSSYTFSYSNISFDIPNEYNITGDSLVFQTVVENTTSDGGFYDYDVVLQITGSQHSAELHFVADTGTQQYNQYYVGNARYYNLPQLVHYFGSFQTIKWVMKKDGTSAYINNKLAYKFNYNAANRIGRVQTINVAGKGYVVVNGVTLLNSYNNKKIMVENFNVDGKSHTVFYQ